MVHRTSQFVMTKKCIPVYHHDNSCMHSKAPQTYKVCTMSLYTALKKMATTLIFLDSGSEPKGKAAIAIKPRH